MVESLYSEFKYDKYVFKIFTSYFYGSNHLWYDYNGLEVKIGLSDYLQQTLGDVAFVTLPQKGANLMADNPSIEIETMKVNHEVSMPFNGIVVEINENLIDSPELLNSNPYDKGWLVTIKVTDVDIIQKKQMSAQEYKDFIQKEVQKS